MMRRSSSSKSAYPMSGSRARCVYKPEFSELYKFIRKSSKSDSHAFCKVCNCDISVAHSGKWDIDEHVKSSKHQRLKYTSNLPKVTDTFFSKSDQELNSVIESECIFANFLVEHNLAISVADHFSDVIQRISNYIVSESN